MHSRLLAAVVLFLSHLFHASAAEKPNFVFLLVDDLGWADLGCNGSTFYETPHIDALAASGMRFTNAYAACPVCSPTRASIMTGRHPVRVDITDWIPGMASSRVKDRRFEHVDDRDNLALEEVTIAETLRESPITVRWFTVATDRRTERCFTVQAEQCGLRVDGRRRRR